MKVLFDILYQSQDTYLIKAKFFIAFCLHYFLKLFGLNVVFFPKMRIKVGQFIMQTREKTIDFWMTWEDFEKEIFYELKKIIRKKITFIDVGANIGRYTLFAANKNWKVCSFEPIENNLLVLKDNVKINNLQKYVKINNFGLGNRNETKKIYFEKHKHGEASIKFKKKSSISEDILIKKLDSIKIPRSKKYILKIDVEGFEFEVLQGAKEFIRNNKPLIIIEIWNRKTENLLKNLNYYREKELWYPKK